MNIETKIKRQLWLTIESNYTSQQFSNSIIDSIYYLGNLIREKTGLENDGVSLIGQAFGGKNPKLKVSKLQNESDWNVQKGIEQILRGLYQAIRNPRSHRKFNDNKDDADSIILFINYLVKIIDQSKTPFTRTKFLERVFDPDFVEKDRYAKLLVNEIPEKYVYDIALDVFTRRTEGDGKKLRIFYKILLSRLSDDSKSELMQSISEELKNTNDNTAIRLTLQILPSNVWSQIEEAPKLRIENKLLQSVKLGQKKRYDSSVISGSLGTWIVNIFDYLILKDEYYEIVLNKLEGFEPQEHNYILYNSLFLDTLVNPPERFKPMIIEIFKEKLVSGDIRYFEASKTLDKKKSDWITELKKEIDTFEEQKQWYENEADDLPF